jgi:hypothetical protein
MPSGVLDNMSVGFVFALLPGECAPQQKSASAVSNYQTSSLLKNSLASKAA